MNDLDHLSTYDRLIVDYLHSIKKKLNHTVKDTSFFFNQRHILARMNERGIILNDLAITFNRFYTPEHMNTLRGYVGEDDSTKPFLINVVGDEAILVFCRRGDQWQMTSILDPHIHNLERESEYGEDYHRRIEV